MNKDEPNMIKSEPDLFKSVTNEIIFNTNSLKIRDSCRIALHMLI